MNKLLPVVLCGGAGSRLWPVSRELHPKPFMRVEDDISLLESAVERSLAIHQVEAVLIVSNHQLSHSIRHVLKAYEEKGVCIYYLWEPVARNTAAAIACAGFLAQELGFAQMLVLPADHLIQNIVAFQVAVNTAQSLAEQKQLVTFGVVPQYAETGYGYIEANCHEVLRFVEKPDLATAQKYLESGKYLWNAGIFLLPVEVLWQEMRNYCADVYETSRIAFAQRTVQNPRSWQLTHELFSLVPDISIDYAIMEQSQDVAVVPCDMGWSDVGSWLAMAEILPSDLQGNCVQGQTLLQDVKNTLVYSQHERVVACAGIENLIIVDTDDAVLVVNKDSAQEVRKIYTQLKQQNHPVAVEHRTVFRPWGSYTTIEEGIGYKVKRIEVYPGQSLSLQLHHHRSEHWVVVQGKATVVNGENSFELEENMSTFVPPKTCHRIENKELKRLVLIEIQVGLFLSEQDIVRFEDVYGRDLVDRVS